MRCRHIDRPITPVPIQPTRVLPGSAWLIAIGCPLGGVLLVYGPGRRAPRSRARSKRPGGSLQPNSVERGRVCRADWQSALQTPPADLLDDCGGWYDVTKQRP